MYILHELDPELQQLRNFVSADVFEVDNNELLVVFSMSLTVFFGVSVVVKDVRPT